MKKKTLLISVFAFAMLLTGCDGSNDNHSSNSNSRNESSSVIAGNSSTVNSDSTSSEATNSSAETSTSSGTTGSNNETSTSSEATGSSAGTSTPSVSGTELSVCFGDSGSPFVLHLYDNDTAAAIARHVGTADWRLPIYHYNDYENWEVMQYYDIPSRYKIPSNPEKITSEKAGEVYYSEPNRIILFYGDANVSSEYTRVGYFDFTEQFKQAVENNPVLEGWGNKIVLISADQ